MVLLVNIEHGFPWSLWTHFGIIWEFVWGYFWITSALWVGHSGPLWNEVSITLGSLGLALDSFRIVGIVWVHFGVCGDDSWYWKQFRANLGLLSNKVWDKFGIALGNIFMIHPYIQQRTAR